MNNNVSETIERFLNNDNEQFVIPNYQRRYAWGNKQVKELSTIHNILLALIYVPLPIFLYDIVYC